jgi:hypothetical protein
MTAGIAFRRPIRVMASVTLFLVVACGGGGDSSAEADGAPEAAVVAGTTCSAATGSLAAGASLRGRAGDYSLTMVGGAQGSAGAASSVQGGLTLLEQSAEMRVFQGADGSAIPGVVSPLYGTTDIQVQEVGALRIGSLLTGDPSAPGVLVIESQTAQGPSILLRFGADANRRDLGLFDGGFTVLELHEISGEGFSGTWTSGAQGSRTEGHFCAERASD